MNANETPAHDAPCPCGEPMGHDRDCGLPYWRGYLTPPALGEGEVR